MSKRNLDRRNFLRYGFGSLGILTLANSGLSSLLSGGPRSAFAGGKGKNSRKGGSSSVSKSGKMFGYTSFSQPLCIPDVMQAQPRGTLFPRPGDYPDPGERVGGAGGPRRPRGIFDDVAHGIAPEFDGRVPGFPCADWNKFTPGKPGVPPFSHFTTRVQQTKCVCWSRKQKDNGLVPFQHNGQNVLTKAFRCNHSSAKRSR